MNLHVLADLHLEFLFQGATPVNETNVLLQSIYDTTADVAVIAGDIDTKGRSVAGAAHLFPPDRPVILVAGNHEYYSGVYQYVLEKLRKEADKFPNVHFLENDAVEIDDVVFLGCTLWTDLELWQAGPQAGLYGKSETRLQIADLMNDYRKIRYKRGRTYGVLQPSNTVRLHLDSVRWLEEQFAIHQGRKIVVVTHHAPSFRSIGDIFERDIVSAAYASHLDELVEKSGAALWIHGHVHDRVDYTIGRTRVVSNGYGYSFESAMAQNFQADWVIEV